MFEAGKIFGGIETLHRDVFEREPFFALAQVLRSFAGDGGLEIDF